MAESSIKKKFVRMKDHFYAAAIGFWKDDCYAKSSVLTLYTLQSIVPFLAFVLGLAHGFGFENYLKEFIINSFEEQKEVINYALKISNTLLEHLKGGVIAGMGFLYLFWTVVTLLGYIEYTLNEIWKVETPRSWSRKLSDYLAITIICPLIVVISSSITVYIKTEISHLKGYPYLEEFSIYLLNLFKLFPFFLSWLLFFLIYALIPNTRNINLKERIIAAILAGTAFQLWQLFYINAQIYIFSYNVVYGTVAVLPLFIIWLQISWLIILAGAEFSAHLEDTYFVDRKAIKKGELEKVTNLQLGLMILHKCLKNFYDGQPPPTDTQIAHELKIPIEATKKILDILISAKILATINFSEGIGYHPLCDPHLFTIATVIQDMQKNMSFEIYMHNSETLRKINKTLKSLENTLESSDANITLDKIV